MRDIGRKAAILVDHIVMALGFIPLTLYTSLVENIGLSHEVLGWGMVSFMAGLSIAFLIASIIPVKPSRIIMVSYVVLSITCLILPYTMDLVVILILRLLQGVSITSIPVLTLHINKLFRGSKGFIASSIVLAGIFTGSYLGTVLPSITRDIISTYILTAIIVFIIIILWTLIYDKDFEKPTITERLGKYVWLDPIVWSWGIGFHILLGILYGFLGLIDYLKNIGLIYVTIDVRMYSLAAIMWTITAGFYGYILSRSSSKNIAHVSINTMIIIYITTITGLLLTVHTTPPLSDVGLLLVTITQAGGVPFWTMVGQIYANKPMKVFATGLIANLGTLTGSLVMKIISSKELFSLVLVVMVIVGLVATITTLISMRKYKRISYSIG